MPKPCGSAFLMPKELHDINLILLGSALIKIYQSRKTEFVYADLPSHTPLLENQFLVKQNFKYPPYLSDWALCHLLSSELKISLKGSYFESLQGCHSNVITVLKEFLETDF